MQTLRRALKFIRDLVKKYLNKAFKLKSYNNKKAIKMNMILKVLTLGTNIKE